MSKSTINTIIICFVLIIVILLGYSFIGGSSSTNNSTSTPSDLNISLDDHVRGNKNGTVTLVEFGDFQCPACGAYEPLTRDVVSKNTFVKFVFRNFPLTQIHPNALLAAKYAEAAGIQGKYWEFHDALYDNQKEWSASLTAKTLFEGYGKKLGLNVQKLTSDANSADIEAKILAQYKEGVNLNVQGTPTFFVNGVKIDNPGSSDAFSKILEDAQKK